MVGGGGMVLEGQSEEQSMSYPVCTSVTVKIDSRITFIFNVVCGPHSNWKYIDISAARWS